MSWDAEQGLQVLPPAKVPLMGTLQLTPLSASGLLWPSEKTGMFASMKKAFTGGTHPRLHLTVIPSPGKGEKEYLKTSFSTDAFEGDVAAPNFQSKNKVLKVYLNWMEGHAAAGENGLLHAKMESKNNVLGEAQYALTQELSKRTQAGVEPGGKVTFVITLQLKGKDGNSVGMALVRAEWWPKFVPGGAGAAASGG